MSDDKLRSGIDQSVVFADELEIIRKRREAAGLDDSKFVHGWFEKSSTGGSAPPSPSLPADRPPLAEADPVGLALSGGGVRSAAFALGIIQAFHRFGLMRYVDYLSAVSGGTYAAGMFTQSMQQNTLYSEQNCDLAPDRSGKSSEFVQRVSARGNYLFRSDLFLARFIPGFVLNLAPQLCLLIAIGSGLAMLWRCLDLDEIRDHLGAFGFNDLGAAYLPAMLFGILWFTSHIVGLIAASQPLKRFSTWMLAATFGSVLIGTAVVIGNGDVTLNTPELSATDDERRIQWLNNLWTPLVSIVGLGCIPLLMPKKLLRSGTQPRGWFDSWIFYYVSLALFIGVPLVFVGYFARENISGYNDARGPTFLLGDIKDPLLLEQLLDPENKSQLAFQFNAAGDNGDFGRLIESVQPVETAGAGDRDAGQPDGSAGAGGTTTGETTANDEDVPLYAVLALPNVDSTRQLQTALKKLSSATNRDHDASIALGAINQFPLPLRSDGNTNNTLEWRQWRYFERFISAPREFVGYLIGTGGASYQARLDSQAADRQHRLEIAEELNRQAKRHPLFRFHHSLEKLRTPEDSVVRVVKVKNLTPALREQLMTIAGLDLDQDNQLDELPIQSYASLNRNLLETTLPGLIRDRRELRRANLIGYDQRHRLIWFVGSTLAAILLGWCINPNQTGLHGYYRDRLAGTYLNRGKNQPGTVYPELDIDPLSAIRPHKQGAPYPLFQTSVLTRQAWEHADQLQRPFRPFVLSPAYCGNRHLKYIDTKSLGNHQPSLADTIAISGGAIDPAFFVHHILAFLINTMNWRMGQLFPNPQATSWRRPNMYQVLVDTLQNSLSPSDSRITSNVLLTDGGHSENLGIEPLLSRRCRLIIVSDAGYDPKHALDDLAKVIRRLESSEGIRLVDVLPSQIDSSPADGQPLRIPGNMAAPMDTSNCDDSIRARHEIVDRLFRRTPQQTEKRHFFVAKILYPECGPADSHGNCEHPEFEGRLIYIKPCLTGDEGLQLCNYAFRHNEFPHESTLDQAFDEAQFEAYRRLGFHSGIDLCRDLPDPQGVDRKDREPSLWSTDAPWNLNRVCDRLLGRDNFGATAIQNRIRSQVEELLKAWNPDTGDAQIARELESFGEDLSFAADLLAELPARDNDFSLHAAVSEHFDQRAVAPLANLLHDQASCKGQEKSIQQAIQWLDQLLSDNEQINLQPAIGPLGEVARWACDPATGLAAVNLLKLIAATSPERKNEAIQGLRDATKNRSIEAVRFAAREAIAALRPRPTTTPLDHTSNGKAKPVRQRTPENGSRAGPRKR